MKHKVMIVAELSANHNGSIDIAKESIKKIHELGADAIKLQTYTPDTITIDCDNEYFQIKKGTVWDGKTLYELYSDAYTPWEWHEELFTYAHEIGLLCFSTPFDITAVDFLETLNNPIYKVASFEITDIPLIRYIAEKGKPVIISTGVAEFEDIERAVSTCRSAGNEDITILKCTSAYPAPLEEMNLLTIQDIVSRFNVKTGLSDHSLGTEAAIAAVSLGAAVIEKHFILDRSLGGPDAGFSMEPHEFKSMIYSIRRVEKALGEISYEVNEKTKRNREFSRSLFVVKDVKAGEIISNDNVRSIRPNFGMHPMYLQKVYGKRFSRSCLRGDPLDWSMVETERN